MKCVKNDVVKMLWEVDKFFENDGAFVAAVQEYNGVCVVFKDNDAFLLADEENPEEVADLEEIRRILHVCEAEGYTIRDEFEDLYIPLYNGSELDEETVTSYGIGMENADDIYNRVADLYPYFEVIYVDNLEEAF